MRRRHVVLMSVVACAAGIGIFTIGAGAVGLVLANRVAIRSPFDILVAGTIEFIAVTVMFYLVFRSRRRRQD